MLVFQGDTWVGLRLNPFKFRPEFLLATVSSAQRVSARRSNQRKKPGDRSFGPPGPNLPICERSESFENSSSHDRTRSVLDTSQCVPKCLGCLFACGHSPGLVGWPHLFGALRKDFHFMDVVTVDPEVFLAF